MAVSDYNVDPDLNTTISGINIAEGCAPSGINNAIRQLMADVKAESDELGDVKADTLLAAQTAANLTSSPVYSDQTYGDPLALAFGKMMTRHAVGEMWVGFSMAEKPAGVLLRDASLQSRGLYAALWQWASDKGLVLTEAEWQAEYAANGVCHKYSDGDGSTTFRMPSAPLYIKGAENAGEAGAYVAEGLPNIIGAAQVRGFANSGNFCVQRYEAGALYERGIFAADVGASATSDANMMATMGFDASRSNPIYGASAHVTPATSKLLFGVWAVSTAGVAIPDANAEEILAAYEMTNAKADAANAGLVGVVRSVNGASADAAGNVKLASWVYTTTRLSSATALGNYPIDLSSHIAGDGEYEALVYASITSNSTTSTTLEIGYGANGAQDVINLQVNTNYARRLSETSVLPVPSNKIFHLYISGTEANAVSFYLMGYRRIA